MMACVLILGCGITVLTIFFMSLDRRTISIKYNTYETVGSNKMYEASISADAVSIKKHNGKEVSEIAIHLLNMIPDEIVLGKNFYYLLQYGEDETIILQMDYNSNIRKRKTIKGLLRAFCVDEFVLVLLEKDNQNYSKFRDSKCINYYIKEKNFERDFVEISQESNETLLRKLKLRYCQNGLYSMLPDIGVEAEDISFYNKVSAVKANEKNVCKKWNILNQLLEQTEIEKDDTIYVKCYQHKNKLYGICNVLTYKFDEECIRTKDIKRAIYFIYDSENNSCRIVYSAEAICGIYFDSKAIFYEKDGVIYKYSLSEQKGENIYQVDKSDDMKIEISSYIMKIYIGNSWGNKGEISLSI